MQLNTVSSPVITSGNMAHSKMALSVENADIFSYFLRDKIYQNKILAVVRENITNALDEVLKFNIQNPVIVSLQDIDGATMWSCRDHAMGLDDEGIRTIFGMYGNSTKRDNNVQSGTFGVGSKSGHSYTDTFYITSHHKGTCIHYAAVLGGGEKGVPIGEIYELYRKPTLETGLEISLDVTKDVSKFRRETQMFVRHSLPDARIEFHDLIYDIVTTPLQSVSSKDIGGFRVSQYDNFDEGYVPSFHIRMGGVVYAKRKDGMMWGNTLIHDIVVDVPVGTLSVPISRESFEDTVPNDKVFDEIKTILRKIHSDDCESARVDIPKLGSMIVKDRISDSVMGTYFKHSFRDVYPDTQKLWNLVEIAGYSVPKTTTGKVIVYVFPDIKNVSSWEKRLAAALEMVGGNTGFYKVRDNAFFRNLVENSLELDLSDVTFAYVKMLNLPKLEASTGRKRFCVYHNGNLIGKLTADELEEYALGKSKTELVDDWWMDVTNMDDLNSRTVDLSDSCGSWNSGYTVKSVTLQKAMVELGWLAKYGTDWNTKKTEISEVVAARRKIEESLQYIQKNFFNIPVHPNITRRVGVRLSSLNRLINRKRLILDEKSTRGKILKLMDQNYYNNTLTRTDLRKIMSLKD